MIALDIIQENCKKIWKLITIGKMKDAEDAACNVVKSIFDTAPTLGIDIDGTIDEAPGFFTMLSRVWPGRVVIITYNKLDAAEQRLNELGMCYDDIVITNTLDKSDVVADNGIDVFIDDQDECIQNIPINTVVMKIRNGGNFENGRWIYSDKTGRAI